MTNIDELSKQQNIFVIVCSIFLFVSLVALIILTIEMRYKMRLIERGSIELKSN